MRRLGPLEATVMDRLWSAGRACTVRDVHDALAGAERAPAYTTVMTVMDNLFRKGLLTRERRGRAYVYAPATTREEHTAALMSDALAGSPDREAALLHFVAAMGEDEARALREAVRRRADPGDAGGGPRDAPSKPSEERSEGAP